MCVRVFVSLCVLVVEVEHRQHVMLGFALTGLGSTFGHTCTTKVYVFLGICWARREHK